MSQDKKGPVGQNFVFAMPHPDLFKCVNLALRSFTGVTWSGLCRPKFTLPHPDSLELLGADSGAQNSRCGGTKV